MTPNGKAEEVVDPSHPLGVALRKVVVNGDDVYAATGDRVKVSRERRNQRFPFAGFHLGDLAGVQDHPANELDVEVTHPEDAPPGLATDGERFREERVEALARALRSLKAGSYPATGRRRAP